MNPDLPDSLIPDLPAGCKPFTLLELKRQTIIRQVDSVSLYEIGPTLDDLIAVFSATRDKHRPILGPDESLVIELDHADYEGPTDIIIAHLRFETDDEARVRLNQIARQRIIALTKKMRRKKTS